MNLLFLGSAASEAIPALWCECPNCRKAAALGGSWLMGQLFGLFGVSRFAIDANPLMVGGLTLGLALVFLVAAYASARKVRRVDVRELVAE